MGMGKGGSFAACEDELAFSSEAPLEQRRERECREDLRNVPQG